MQSQLALIPIKSNATPPVKSKPKTRRTRSRRRGPRNNPRPLLESFGNMSISAPVAQGKKRSSTRPKFLSVSTAGDIVVQHREYVGDILGSVAFTSSLLPLNPGLPASFPWLNGIAQRFESYRFDRLKLCFETESATSFTGSVFMGVDFDPSDTSPENKIQVMTYRSSVRSPPWSDCCMNLTPEDLSKRKTYFIRNGPPISDVKLYDTGNWFVCTQGQANASTVGEVYVEYTVKLMTPQLNTPSLGEAVYGVFSGTTNAAPFTNVFGNLPATAISTGTTTSVTTWTFTQPWQGVVTIAIIGTTLTNITIGGTALSNLNTLSINTAATEAIAFIYLVAQAGQTFISTISDASITNASANFAQAMVSSIL